MTFTQSSSLSSEMNSPTRGSSARVALRPSEEQSEMGQPWSLVEKGQAPFEMCLYHDSRSPGQSSRTWVLSM